MSRSLSVLLPVKNVQYTLAPTVHKILDCISEVSEQVELLIIDEGSADATSEIAADLTRHYPQVRAIYQSQTSGRQEAIRSGLRKSTGEIALIHEEQSGMPLLELLKMLKTTAHKGQFFFRLDKVQSPGVKKQVNPPLPSIQLRNSEQSGERQSRVLSRPARPNFLERLKNIVIGE